MVRIDDMICTTIRDKIFKNGPSRICGRQPLKNLKDYGLLKLEYFVRYERRLFKNS